MNNNTIEKSQVFRIDCECWGEFNGVYFQAVNKISIERLERLIDTFSTSLINSYSACINTLCKDCNMSYDLDLKLCPSCKEGLYKVYQPPTLSQFAETHKQFFTQVQIETIFTDKLMIE